jgi:hypothetical protein
MAKIIQDQNIDVDIAMLHASIVESKGDVRDTIIQAIDSTLRENPKYVSSQDKSAIAQSIYDKIISISQTKYNTDIAKNITRKNAGGKKQRKRRKTSRLRNRRSQSKKTHK